MCIVVVGIAWDLCRNVFPPIAISDFTDTMPRDMDKDSFGHLFESTSHPGHALLQMHLLLCHVSITALAKKRVRSIVRPLRAHEAHCWRGTSSAASFPCDLSCSRGPPVWPSSSASDLCAKQSRTSSCQTGTGEVSSVFEDRAASV